jgi:hypothetical protein
MYTDACVFRRLSNYVNSFSVGQKIVYKSEKDSESS